jgi:hypothetical protein
MNSLGLLTLVSDAGSAGLRWADRWLAGPRMREAREVLAGLAVKFWSKTFFRVKPFSIFQTIF